MGLQIVRENEPKSRQVLAAVYSQGFDRGSRARPGDADTRTDRVLPAPRLGRYLTSTWTMASRARKIPGPQLNRLMRDAHARRFDVVVCWRFDRFQPLGVSPVPGAGDFQRPRHSVRLALRASGHQHSDRQARFHDIGSGRGGRAEPDRGARAGRASERTCERQALGRPRVDVDIDTDRIPASFGYSWRTIARNVKSVGGNGLTLRLRREHAKALCA